MGHSKLFFGILTFTLFAASSAVVADSDDGQYRYLRPLSTNVSPDDVKDFDEPEFKITEDSIYMERDESDEEDNDKDLEYLLKHPKVAIDHFRNSKRKLTEIEREIEREIQKRRQDKEKELKKILAEIDREHRKHIVEIERERRKLLQEIEREYKENLKKLN
jgi:hypothetical protein